MDWSLRPGEVAVFSEPKRLSLNPVSGYWDGPGDLVSGLVKGICRVSIWVKGLGGLLTHLLSR